MNKCIHYWEIDAVGYGKCRLCPAEKDFALSQKRAYRQSQAIQKAQIGQEHSKITRIKV